MGVLVVQAEQGVAAAFIEVRAQHLAELRRAYDEAYPSECCGVLLGLRSGTQLTVRRVINTLNAVSTAGGFAIPDHEILRVRVLAEESRLAIVAVFHSHPSGSTELSSSDQIALQYSRWPWVIVTAPRTSGVVLTLCQKPSPSL